jgi:hypothetical protein
MAVWPNVVEAASDEARDGEARDQRDVMAQLTVRERELTLALTRGEKLEGLHGDLRVPLSSVVGVDVLEDAHGAADIIGLKVGTRLAGVTEVTTVHGAVTVFAAVHRDTPRGVRVRLSGADQDEWIVGCADPEGVAAAITSAL